MQSMAALSASVWLWLDVTCVTSKRLNTATTTSSTTTSDDDNGELTRPATVKPFYSQLQQGKRFMVFVLLHSEDDDTSNRVCY